MMWLKSSGHNIATLLVAGLLVGYALSFNNATGWALATITLGLVLLSLLSLLPRLSRIPVQVQLSPTPQGDLLTFQLAKNWRTENVTLQRQQPNGQLHFNPDRQRFETPIGLPRGIYTTVDVILTKTDPLHLFIKRRRRTLPTLLIVPPQPNDPLAQALFLQLRPWLKPDQAMSSTSPGMVTRDFRPYQPGDPSNQIDWKLSAKQQQPMLRVLDSDDPSAWCWLFFTTTTSQLENHLAAFYSFCQLTSDLPAQVYLIGTTQQLVTGQASDAFASYQPYAGQTVPITMIQRQQVILFGDDGPLSQALLAELRQHNSFVKAIQWPKGGANHANTL
ncbi:DUF58 domain-containing protein [Lactiplantibacillus sp. WILCCON 0030]|uniref:DUF58 domain-containing protein n=1 Tax=Lactiplantibacillus brownii TaxID=3069269 RepID=A0ABU1ACJ9_9LACO|nr:DUF58 domain-containing protein [Lactiplantibacillus brownii]MDQ7938103.1 DUF58 domain-containing protein [Lactiplantibacillus brownii]